jgi:hypothetical protein
MSVGLPTAPVREKESMINAPQQQIPGVYHRRLIPEEWGHAL